MSVSDNELLRLAHKAFAALWAERVRLVSDDHVDPSDIAQWDHYSITAGMNNHAGRVEDVDAGEVCRESFEVEAPTREAAHAALLVLAGETSPAADSGLCAALDQLADMRDKLDTALVAAESDRAARGRAVNTAQLLTALLERAIAELVRAGQGDVASLLSEQLRAALRDRA